MENTTDILARFAPISLAEMDDVKLQDRMDSKFVFSEADLAEVLTHMVTSYRLLEVGGHRGTAYRSLYLDTADLRCYRDHHDQRTFRSKVRYREYLGSGLCFLEVKRKTGRGRTDKARLRVDHIPEHPPLEHRVFITGSGGPSEELVPVLWNYFTRYTFVRRDAPERLTMDLGLRFSDPGGTRSLGDIVVAELKQPRIDHASPFMRLMRERGIRPGGMSKYCVGMLMLGRPVKHNAFKPVLRLLDRLRHAA